MTSVPVPAGGGGQHLDRRRAAAVLGGVRDKPIAALERLWRETDRASADARIPGIYETGPLRRTLAKLTDLDTLNHGRWPFRQYSAQPGHQFSEQCEPDNPDIHRELIVVELFPMKAPLPRSLPEVFNRMAQLQYTSRIKLDEKLFDKIGKVVRLIERVNTELPADSSIREDEDRQSLLGHRKIDSFTVIAAHLDPDLTNAGGFARPSVEARIRAGHDDAKRQGVACPAALEPAPPATRGSTSPPEGGETSS